MRSITILIRKFKWVQIYLMLKKFGFHLIKCPKLSPSLADISRMKILKRTFWRVYTRFIYCWNLVFILLNVHKIYSLNSRDFKTFKIRHLKKQLKSKYRNWNCIVFFDSQLISHEISIFLFCCTEVWYFRILQNGIEFVSCCLTLDL